MTGISKYNFMPRRVAMQNSKMAPSASSASGASGSSIPSDSGSIQPTPLPSGGSASDSTNRLSEYLDKMSDYAKNDVKETKTEDVATRGSENTEPKKPTLDNMNDLFAIWKQYPLQGLPSSLIVMEVAGERHEALENYIKENNLNIDVNNLEIFFHDKEYTLNNEEVRTKAFQDYIENGYDTSLSLMHLDNSDKTDTESELQKLIDGFDAGAKALAEADADRLSELEAFKRMMDNFLETAAKLAQNDAERIKKDWTDEGSTDSINLSELEAWKKMIDDFTKSAQNAAERVGREFTG